MDKGRTKALTIRTPEGIAFSMQLAGPISRFLAWAIDWACLASVLAVASIFLQIFSIVTYEFGAALRLLVAFVVSMAYAIVLEWFWRGQTLGKRVLRLRVIDERGLRVRFSQIVVRNLLRAVDSLPLFYLIGGVAALVHPKGQRLGDIGGGTVVVRVPEMKRPNLEKLMADKYNSFRDHPHLTARLLKKVSPEEAFLALRALLRRDELDPLARVALFEELAAHFKRIVPFPQNVVDGLADERYVRNVVDVMFRPRETGRSFPPRER